ncbi:DUF2125 domain-containing protein [Desertibaculum subflavum]|uniref:DUF2125 domain-containing protein n=1 Tax=Desertibaculum subflavum TaxID=2268458 RepID=UPI0013C47E52
MRLRIPYLVIIAVIVAGIAGWTGYWFWLQGRVEQEVAAWVEARQAEGYEIADAGRRIGGFPARMQVTVAQPTIAKPGHWRWQAAGQVVVYLQPWNLTHVIVNLGPSHQLEWVEGDTVRRAGVTAERALASGIFSGTGRLEQGALDIARPVVVDSATGTSSADRAQLHSRANHGETEQRPDDSLSLALQIDNAALPPAANTPLGNALALLRINATLPPPLPPPSRRAEALEAWRAAGGVVNLDRFELRWGPLDADGSGTVAIDRELRPLFALATELRGFGPTLDAYAEAGLLKPKLARNAKFALTALAKPDSNGRPTVKLPISAQDGRLYLGPVGVADLAPIVPR